MEKILSEEEKQRIKCPYWRNIIQKKEFKKKKMVVLSEKGKEISIKTEVASSLTKSVED